MIPGFGRSLVAVNQMNQLFTSKNDDFPPGLASNARELCQGPLLSDAIILEASLKSEEVAYPQLVGG